MTITVTHLYRYPVKGLSPEPLEAADLSPGRELPQDRRFALAHGSTRFDPARPQWLPKTSFLMLMKNERLARLETRFDEATGVLSIHRDGKKVVAGDIRTQVGRALIEDFFSAFMAGEVRGRPHIVEGRDHTFSDHRGKVISIINLASLREIERAVGAPVDHRRFRANVYIDGAAPWAELQWPGRAITLGEAGLEVTAAIDRCAATNVNPGTGERDLQIPRALMTSFGHIDCGVYARVTTAGQVRVGDAVRLDEPAPAAGARPQSSPMPK